MFLSAIIFPLVSDIYQVLLSNSPQDFFYGLSVFNYDAGKEMAL